MNATIELGLENSTLPEVSTRVVSTEERRVAVMIDWENMEVPRRKQMQGVSQKILITTIRQYADQQGDVRVATAVAGFSERDGKTMWMLNVNGIVPKITMTKAVNGKVQSNAADIHLVVEAMHTLMNDPTISDFVIFTGDGGFLPLLRLLKAEGKNVTIVGPTNESTSSHLIREADKYTTIQNLVEVSA
tara:strand:- start:830 stop:1396 length:567 start_codon:yes stop_codon:yes gene_type:complete